MRILNDFGIEELIKIIIEIGKMNSFAFKE